MRKVGSREGAKVGVGIECSQLELRWFMFSVNEERRYGGDRV
jgi:hypothetical protein